MKKIILSALTLLLAIFISGCGQEAATPKALTQVEKTQSVSKTAQNNVQIQPDIRIRTADNSKGTITIKSIEKAFKDNGFEISTNNDMSLSFEKKFGKKDPTAGKDFKIYRLMPVLHSGYSVKLIKDYPEFGLIAPISTSVYSKDGKEISISSLSINAMSRMTGVPENNPDLKALYAALTKALTEALPNGKFKDLTYNILRADGPLVTRFAFVLPNESGNIEDALEAYEEQMLSLPQSVQHPI